MNKKIRYKLNNAKDYLSMIISELSLKSQYHYEPNFLLNFSTLIRKNYEFISDLTNCAFESAINCPGNDERFTLAMYCASASSSAYSCKFNIKFDKCLSNLIETLKKIDKISEILNKKEENNVV